MWTTEPISSNDYPMIAITLKNNKIYISKLMIYLNTDSASYKDIANIELNDNLSFSEGYFYYEKYFG